ncbi:hypothetical protein WG954_00730 [Lacibacter sp. H375]|uniref:hypothetical protein n=1 Tax=Lacibacter sp. H375 TaxID=3133424 RepID=UPI0030C03E7C
MLITKDTPKLSSKTPKPELKWQTEHYSRRQEFRFQIPYGFLLLCKLLDTTPNDMLHWFMENCSYCSFEAEGKEQARAHLQDYIIAMHYGQEYYTQENIRQMMNELNAINMLWPKNAKPKFQTAHANWRNNYFNFWYKKWHRHPRRRK